MLLKVILFLCLFFSIECNDTPGFFLKVSKNIPRIGRRSGELDHFFLKSSKSVPRIGRRDQYVDNSNFPDDMVQQWYDRVMTPSKRSAGYNNVQPFDTKFLLDIFASEHLNPEDFKFVAWKDFDIALESDEQLFRKLIELAKTHKEVGAFTENMHFDQFVPMDGGNDGKSLFYRTERSDPSDGRLNGLTKEKIQYQS